MREGTILYFCFGGWWILTVEQISIFIIFLIYLVVDRLTGSWNHLKCSQNTQWKPHIVTIGFALWTSRVASVDLGFFFLGYASLVVSDCLVLLFGRCYTVHLRFAITANVNSLVVFWPPRSLVRTLPFFNTRWMALVIISLYECKFTWRNSFVLHSSMAVGLATFLPTASENVWRAPYKSEKHDGDEQTLIDIAQANEPIGRLFTRNDK